MAAELNPKPCHMLLPPPPSPQPAQRFDLDCGNWKVKLSEKYARVYLALVLSVFLLRLVLFEALRKYVEYAIFFGSS